MRYKRDDALAYGGDHLFRFPRMISPVKPTHAEAPEEIHRLEMKINLWEHAFVHPDLPLYALSIENEVEGGLVPDFTLHGVGNVRRASQNARRGLL